jgi:hypothetical protein
LSPSQGVRRRELRAAGVTARTLHPELARWNALAGALLTPEDDRPEGAQACVASDLTSKEEVPELPGWSTTAEPRMAAPPCIGCNGYFFGSSGAVAGFFTSASSFFRSTP